MSAETRAGARESPPRADRSRVSGIRVMAVAPTPFFGDYGCHVRIVEEVSALRERGVATTIATYPFGRDLPELSICRAPRWPGQRRVEPGSSLHKLSMDAALAAQALRVARAQRPDLIHGHLHEGALIAWGVARIRKVPMVFDFQGSLTSEMIDHGFLAPATPGYAAVRAVERWIVGHAGNIVTSTYHGADVLMREFGCPAARITVVPDAVNTQRFRPLWEAQAADGYLAEVSRLRRNLGIPQGQPIVVYLGLLAEYQGITHLLHAAQSLVRQGVDLHFLIMGFPGEERYRSVARQLGISERLTFTGPIPYEHAAAYLAMGTIAVSPKLSLTEGNGKLLNYIAMGLPTVAYDTPVSREILGPLGIYAPCGDWAALAMEIREALRDPRAAEQRGRALRAKALTSHTWDRSVEPLLDLYTRLLS